LTPPTDWTPGLIVLCAALSLGIGLVLRSRRGAALPAPESTRRDELLRQKEALYGLLREHESARGVGAADWAAERDRLELDAARVLRALDALGDPAAVGAARPPSFGTRNPQLVGALWGGGAVLFLGALALTLQEFSAPRPEGGTMTGNASPGGSGSGSGGGAAAGPQQAISPAQEAEIVALTAKVDAAPADVAARNALGHALLQAGKLMDSYQQAEAVVKVNPDDAESRTHQAIALIAIGESDKATKMLDRVLEVAPDFGEALAYRGAIHFQNAEGPQAIAMFERALVAAPEFEDAITPVLAAARAGKFPSKAAPGAVSDGPVASAPARVTGPTPDDIGGTVAIDAALAATVKPGDILFLSARPPGVTRGPPTWVKRVPVTSFPLTFTLGPADDMVGVPVPAELVVTARIDRDGNPVTKTADDLEGKSETLKPGTKGVVITLAAAAVP
jgi:tetratricopeptide (TPR) repeat protein